MKNLKAEKSYFRGNSKFGRTTKLVDVVTGQTLIECMGICSKKELISSYNKSK